MRPGNQRPQSTPCGHQNRIRKVTSTALGMAMDRRLALVAAVVWLPCAGNASAQPVGEIKEPLWSSQPSPQQASAVYPLRAMANEKIGVAVVRCAVAADGRLGGCSLACETPANWGFGAAAIKLTSFYRMKATLPDGRPVEGGTVTLPFFFNPPFLNRLPRCDVEGS